MPSLSTNTTDDNNISTFVISELDLDQFTHFNNGDSLSNLTLYIHRISLRSTNIDRTKCLKSWLLSNITAWEGLVATSVVSS